MRYATRRGFSITEPHIAISIIAIVLAITVPNVHRHIMSAHEHAAIEEIGTLHKAITQYYTQYRRYPQNLVELGPPATGADGPESANLIPRGLATGRKSGFVFTLTRTATGYAINAVPETFGDTAARTFYSDQAKSVHYNLTAEPANANSPEL